VDAKSNTFLARCTTRYTMYPIAGAANACERMMNTPLVDRSNASSENNANISVLYAEEVEMASPSSSAVAAPPYPWIKCMRPTCMVKAMHTRRIMLPATCINPIWVRIPIASH